MNGVNLGGWLVTERWITPSLYNGLDALDEYGLCQKLGLKAHVRLNRHYNSWIQEKDIAWIAENKLDALRVPIGYWIFGGEAPFVANIEYLDWLMMMAEKYELKVIIDLHGAPGSQNGEFHSGLAGAVGWPKQQVNIQKTVDVIERLAQRYKKSPALHGIELLNEPSRKIPKRTLWQYYEKGYEAVRRQCDGNVAVIISDGFRPRYWRRFIKQPQYINVIMDIHLYQLTGFIDRLLSLEGHIFKTNYSWRKLLNNPRNQPAIVGEWGLHLDKSVRGVKNYDRALYSYGTAQQEVFKIAQGNFFWTYKTEDGGPWSYRDCVKFGWLN